MTKIKNTVPFKTKFYIMENDHLLGWQGCDGVFDTLDDALQGLDDWVHGRMRRGFECWGSEFKIHDGVVFWQTQYPKFRIGVMLK